MGLTQIFSNEELESRVKIAKNKRVEYNHYNFASEEENNKLRNSAIEIFAPEKARFFRIIEINPINEYARAVQIEYYS